MIKEKFDQLINLRKEIKKIEQKMKHEGTVYTSVNTKLLEERIHMAAGLETEITEYINSVNDSKVRMIMQYKYIDGYTWKKIANIMHYDRSYPEKAVTRYLKKNCN